MRKYLDKIFYLAAVILGGVAVVAYVKQMGQIWYLGFGAGAGFCLFAALVVTTTLHNAALEAKNAGVSLKKKDIILQAGQEYVVSKRGTVRPGEYQVMSTDENEKAFNLRVNDYVKEYKHNTTIVLTEGDTISPRSANVILR